MDLLNRPLAPNPYAGLPAVPSFTVESDDFKDGDIMPKEQLAGGENRSPHLKWYWLSRRHQIVFSQLF